jgi:hypothetical protein
MDIISYVPLLMEESESLKHAASLVDSSAHRLRAVDLAKDLINMGQKLHCWMRALRQSMGRPLHWAVPATAHNPSDDAYSERLFPFALEFESLDIAMPVVLASGVILQILGALLHLSRLTDPDQNKQQISTTFVPINSPNWNSSADQSTLDDLLSQLFSNDCDIPFTNSIRTAADKLARFACQALQYCHRMELGTFGPQSTCHIQWTLRSYFRQTGSTRELEWCRSIKMMNGPNFRGGIELMFMTEDDDTSTLYPTPPKS